LQGLARREGASLFMVLHAGLAAVLTRMGAGKDIVLGSPIAGRTDEALNDLVGFFVNTLVLRTDTTGNPSFRKLLGEVRENDLNAYAHQEIPFEYLVEELNPVRALNRHPLFQVMLSLQNNRAEELEMSGLRVEVEAVGGGPAKFDLTFNFREERRSGGEAEGIMMQINYAVDLYERGTVEKLGERLVRGLQWAVERSGERIEEMALLSEQERDQLIYEWNETEKEFAGRERSVVELFEGTVEARRDGVAVVWEEMLLSYGELNRRANRVGHYLRELGVGPELRVGICVERSLEMVIGIMGIVKAGGAYVPLDPDYPEERLRYMVEDSGAKLVLTAGKWMEKFRGVKGGVRLIDMDEAKEWSQQPERNVEGVGISGENLVYVIYTSGSTGRPKGVEIAQRNLMNLVRWHHQAYDVKAEDRSTQVASQTFDAAAWEIWSYLLSGSRLDIADEETRRSPTKVGQWIVEREISLCFLPTPMAEAVLKEQALAGAHNLRALLTGGDQLRDGKWDDGVAVVNHYGPTEATVVTTWFELTDKKAEGFPPIGKPIANARAYVLGQDMEVVPAKAGGELYIGGEGVARGYIGRREETAERFVPDPYSGKAGERLYRTGDRVRWRDDGNLEFLERNDSQVKIRGFRIEVGEIEARLMEHPAVREAVVTLREDAPGDRRLVAYYTDNAGSKESAKQLPAPLQAEQLRAHLAAILPAYMVPAAYVRLARLPLTSNGKLDRKALPCPEAEAYSTRAYEPPYGEIETAVAALWAEALKVERVGRQDNFFDLGGHSLLAVSVTTRLRQTLNVEIGIRELFAHPVLADLAEIVKGATQAQHVPIARARRKERSAIVASGKITATGSNGHKIASDDNGRTWYDLQTGKAIQ